MKYLKRVEGDCDTCVLKTTRACIKVRCYMYHNFRLATPDEIAAYKRKHPERCRNIGPESICPLSGNVVGDNQSCVGCQYAVLINYKVAMELLCAHPSDLPGASV